MVHEVKCWPEFFNALVNGNKTFEVRKNDRPYRVGDYLAINEYVPDSEDPRDDFGVIPLSNDERRVNGGRYSGKSILCEITYILDNKDFCREGTVILGICCLGSPSELHKKRGCY